jgi:PKD repeat protein
MRRARHTTLALVLGLALSLVAANSAWAVTVSVSDAVVNPNEEVTATADLSDLTAPELLLVSAVHFRFTGDDADERTDTAAPYSAPFTYTSAGIKTITMRVEFTAGADQTASVEMRVNAAPRAAFTRNLIYPNVGQTVRFDAGPTTDDQEVAGTPGFATLPASAYDWDLDNNGGYETANSRVVQRSFASPGNKVVRLRVTDSGGRTDTFATTLHVNFPPVAALTFSPLTPRTTDLINFTSLSDDPDGPLASEQWDLDGDGQYDDAGGPAVSRRFPAAGLHTVRLRVVDILGRASTTATTFNVLPVDVPEPTRIRPWPKIRIVGFAGSKRIRLDLLTVKTLKGATIKVRCSGKGCPRRKAVSTRANDGLVRLRWLERRLRPGTHIYLAITYPGKIGRYERILLRKRKRPLRRMQCLWPGEPGPRACS